MEILSYYIIIAFSFAIMYSINYGWKIVQTVLDVVSMFDFTAAERRSWNPWYYMSMLIMFSFVAMPMFLYLTLAQDKYETIKFASAHILQKYYGLERESNDN